MYIVRPVQQNMTLSQQDPLSQWFNVINNYNITISLIISVNY